MILIIGGAYQGKSAFALENYEKEKIIDDFHLKILELIKSNQDPMKYIRDHIEEYLDKVVICEDLSCGVVPIDPLMRQWRETIGHSLSILVKECDEVFRLFCGIATKLK